MEFVDHRGDIPTPRQPLPVCSVDHAVTGTVQVGASVYITQEDQDLLEMLMRHLLPTPVVSPPEATPIPSERDLLIQSLMGNIHPAQPLLQERSSFTDMEILLHNLLPVGSPVMEEPRLPKRQKRPLGVCFSCGESSHAASRCPTLNETFPFLPTGWQADRVVDKYAITADEG